MVYITKRGLLYKLVFTSLEDRLFTTRWSDIGGLRPLLSPNSGNSSEKRVQYDPCSGKKLKSILHFYRQHKQLKKRPIHALIKNYGMADKTKKMQQLDWKNSNAEGRFRVHKTSSLRTDTKIPPGSFCRMTSVSASRKITSKNPGPESDAEEVAPIPTWRHGEVDVRNIYIYTCVCVCEYRAEHRVVSASGAETLIW